MSATGRLGRVPIESGRPVTVFAVWRLGVVLVGIALLIAVGVPYGGRLTLFLAAVGLPWALLNVWLAARRPALALNPLVAVGDLLLLSIAETLAPDIYGAVRLFALAFLGVHAHLQGERIGLLLGGFGSAALIISTALSGEAPVSGEQLVFLEAAFVASALVAVTLIGRFRTAESTSRLRARAVTRRAFAVENQVRRELAASLHDGPIQELIGLEMELAALEGAIRRQDSARADAIATEARRTIERNVRALRDEIVQLGPSAFEQLSYEAAVERCVPIWERRHGCRVRLEVDTAALPSEMEGDLFRITQEAVGNACRHGEAANVAISLRAVPGGVRLVITDDGRGFGVLPASEPGHIGVASMRERADLHDGTLTIDSSLGAGTTVTVLAPTPGAPGRADA